MKIVSRNKTLKSFVSHPGLGQTLEKLDDVEKY